jgi:hypothetical protein
MGTMERGAVITSAEMLISEKEKPQAASNWAVAVISPSGKREAAGFSINGDICIRSRDALPFDGKVEFAPPKSNDL